VTILRGLILICALLATDSATDASKSTVVRVPRGGVIMTDGVMNDTEWAEATVVEQGSIRLAMQSGDGFLQIGLRTPPLFVASLCIEREDEVHIFHASSAVGHGVYRRGSEAWTLRERFEWRLRGRDDLPATTEEQARHLEEFGWVANTVTAGNPGETEFRISSGYLRRPVRIALGLLLEGDGTDVVGWPVAPDADGCTQRSTIAGPLPDTVAFDPSTWVRLELATD